MRALLIGLIFHVTASRAALPIGPEFWDSYVPYRQYSAETLRDLIALREGDLLETARDIDGLELRVIGREAPGSALVSARVVIDSFARERLQVKVIPFDLSPDGRGEPLSKRRQLTMDQADSLVALLEDSRFWDAPYAAGPGSPVGDSDDCRAAGHWLVEAVRPGSYQIIARSSCDTADAIVTGIRNFLLDIADLEATGEPLQ